MKEKIIVKVFDEAGSFAENKDIARKLRVEKVLPALKEGRTVVLDFAKVEASTQSFVHALMSQPLQERGPTLLQDLQFKNCNQLVRELILTVVDYTLNPADSDPGEV